ncbi:hypothetical protein AB0B12_10010 [Streptomyces sp. NPDC044780]|uniref:hypothetical protein n=1 Tax=unclassified Streptomyces TaxID=2593676 RepID=UPI0033D69614
MISPPAGRVRPEPLPIGERLRPAGPVAGFLALLALLFALAYTVGGLAGPVAPGMRPAGGGGQGHSGPAEHGDMGDPHGTHDMGAPATGAGRSGSR